MAKSIVDVILHTKGFQKLNRELDQVRRKEEANAAAAEKRAIKLKALVERKHLEANQMRGRERRDAERAYQQYLRQEEGKRREDDRTTRHKIQNLQKLRRQSGAMRFLGAGMGAGISALGIGGGGMGFLGSFVGGHAGALGFGSQSAVGGFMKTTVAVGALTAGLIALRTAAAGVRAGLDFERTTEMAQIQLKILMGSASDAKLHLQDLVEYARNSPFDIQGLIQATVVLENFGGAAMNNMDFIKKFGDAVAVSGASMGQGAVGVKEVARQLGQLYQLMQQGRGFGQELRSLVQRGIVNVRDVQRLQRTVEQIKAADLEGTTEGAAMALSAIESVLAKFSGGAAEAVETLSGQEEKLKETFAQASNEILKQTGALEGYEKTVRGLNMVMEEFVDYQKHMDRFQATEDYYPGMSRAEREKRQVDFAGGRQAFLSYVGPFGNPVHTNTGAGEWVVRHEVRHIFPEHLGAEERQMRMASHYAEAGFPTKPPEMPGVWERWLNPQQPPSALDMEAEYLRDIAEAEDEAAEAADKRKKAHEDLLKKIREEMDLLRRAYQGEWEAELTRRRLQELYDQQALTQNPMYPPGTEPRGPREIRSAAWVPHNRHLYYPDYIRNAPQVETARNVQWQQIDRIFGSDEWRRKQEDKNDKQIAEFDKSNKAIDLFSKALQGVTLEVGRFQINLGQFVASMRKKDGGISWGSVGAAVGTMGISLGAELAINYFSGRRQRINENKARMERERQDQAARTQAASRELQGFQGPDVQKLDDFNRAWGAMNLEQKDRAWRRYAEALRQASEEGQALSHSQRQLVDLLNAVEAAVKALNDRRKEEVDKIREEGAERVRGAQRRSRDYMRQLARQQRDDLRALNKRTNDEIKAVQKIASTKRKAIQDEMREREQAIHKAAELEKRAIQKQQAAKLKVIDADHDAAVRAINAQHDARMKTIDDRASKLAEIKAGIDSARVDIGRQIFDLPELEKAIKALQSLGALTLEQSLGFLGRADRAHVDWREMESTAQKYNLGTQQLGLGFWQARTSGRGGDLAADYRLLTDAGGDRLVIAEAMRTELQQLVHQAEESGSEIPTALKEVLQVLIDQQRLKSLGGETITDIESLKFGDPIKEELQLLLTELESIRQSAVEQATADREALVAETEKRIAAQELETEKLREALAEETEKRLEAVDLQTEKLLEALKAEADRRIEALNIETERQIDAIREAALLEQDAINDHYQRLTDDEQERLRVEVEAIQKETDKRIAATNKKFDDLIKKLWESAFNPVKFKELMGGAMKQYLDEESPLLKEMNAIERILEQIRDGDKPPGGDIPDGTDIDRNQEGGTEGSENIGGNGTNRQFISGFTSPAPRRIPGRAGAAGNVSTFGAGPGGRTPVVIKLDNARQLTGYVMENLPDESFGRIGVGA